MCMLILIEAITLAGVVLTVGLVVRYWPVLPERIPIHFGFDGEVDNWGGKAWLVLVPIVTVLMWALMTVMGLDLSIAKENADAQYRLLRTMVAFLKLELVWLFYYITLKQVRTATGEADGLGKWFLPVVLLGTFTPIALCTILCLILG